MDQISSASGSEGMQHSESMHKSHHGNQTGSETAEGIEVVSFQKTNETKQLKLYNEKGQIVTK
jgi:hypothetical protein